MNTSTHTARSNSFLDIWLGLASWPQTNTYELCLCDSSRDIIVLAACCRIPTHDPGLGVRDELRLCKKPDISDKSNGGREGCLQLRNGR
ncbi:hypothetical protein THAOC_03562 [Thalassiosira oceanica]|uniref:Uncharacterized protein n=1 Tax=Thalassiosira oceanica TaxID=159749 RepID=K0TPR2_THAOC|nr:hypothetical protein THAOC_03562 [Thalassiosira oceanica]|eukprot:EJK74742.1 hypothetical protein THAOC_03562 [Thalassiosira oceanica]